MTTPRLVERPVFVLSGIRSGSTLLRCVLNSHSRVYAPHELHLTGLRVAVDSPYAELAMDAAGLDSRELEHLLWDRLLHDLLVESGMDTIVEKTPGNAPAWRRLAGCWPAARFVFLLRDPADVLASALSARPDRTATETTEIVLDLLDAVAEARAELPGHQVRYEDLVADPAGTVAGLCAFLELPYEPAMLDYQVPTVLEPGIGDYTEKIRTGRILAGRAGSPAGELGGRLAGELATRRGRWGYGDG